MEPVTHTYDVPLVILSVLVAIFSSFVALNISSQLSERNNSLKIRWVLSGSVVMGLGIWAMHFIAMLALHSSMEVTYSLPIVILSIIPALMSCAIAFSIISRPVVSRKSLLVGAFLIGSGIISMHYIGMEAMQMNSEIQYEPLWLALSAVIAFVTSLVALHLLFYSRELRKFHWSKIASALVMALAVSGMHYTGMLAATFSTMGTLTHTPMASINTTYLGLGIGAGMLVILSIASNSIRINKRIIAQSDESERKFQSVIESANDAIIVANQMGSIIQWNHGAETIFGYSKVEVLGENLEIIIPKSYRKAHNAGIERFNRTNTPTVIGKTVELMGLRKDGSEFPIDISLGSWVTEQGVFFSSIIRDVTERRQSEEKISRLVYLDPLTGLPNRRLFNDRLTSVLARAEKNEKCFSLLYMDLDHFKLINDTFGHSVGDNLLMEVTERLQQQMRENDTISRLGGDEFIFLLPETDYNQAAAYAQQVLECFREAFNLSGEELFITPSIGISLYPTDGHDAETLIKNADLALYRVKDEGKNNFQFFTPTMNEEVSRSSKIAIGIRKGLERKEFNIHYQPQIDIKTREIIGVEALVRWIHPYIGPISPGEFIPIAEETGSIIQLGEFVLRKACVQNKEWQDAGLPPFRVAVNISARQFSQAKFLETVESALSDSNLDAKYLELELTESIIQGSTGAIEMMQKLKDMGIHLSIDDFGTGYSSLNYLKRLPVNTLKIDQCFTRNIHVDPKDAALVDTIIRMAHNLELNVIAEGVETDGQLEFLTVRHCNQAQGYFFNKPLPAEEVERLYKKPTLLL